MTHDGVDACSTGSTVFRADTRAAVYGATINPDPTHRAIPVRC